MGTILEAGVGAGRRGCGLAACGPGRGGWLSGPGRCLMQPGMMAGRGGGVACGVVWCLCDLWCGLGRRGSTETRGLPTAQV